MNFAEIEAELPRLTPDELRQLAMKSWTAFMQTEALSNVCDEADPRLLSALDDAIAKADATPAVGHSSERARVRLTEWTSR